MCIRDSSYAALITEAIGDGWLADAGELAKLEAFVKDSAFLERAARSKRENKERLARYVRAVSYTHLDVYKRQVWRTALRVRTV